MTICKYACFCVSLYVCVSARLPYIINHDPHISRCFPATLHNYRHPALPSPSRLTIFVHDFLTTTTMTTTTTMRQLNVLMKISFRFSRNSNVGLVTWEVVGREWRRYKRHHATPRKNKETKVTWRTRMFCDLKETFVTQKKLMWRKRKLRGPKESHVKQKKVMWRKKKVTWSKRKSCCAKESHVTQKKIMWRKRKSHYTKVSHMTQKKVTWTKGKSCDAKESHVTQKWVTWRKRKSCDTNKVIWCKKVTWC